MSPSGGRCEPGGSRGCWRVRGGEEGGGEAVMGTSTPPVSPQAELSQSSGVTVHQLPQGQRRSKTLRGVESLMIRNSGDDILSNYFRMRNVSDSLSQRQNNRNSSYLDLLELVTTELNLKDFQVDPDENFPNAYLQNNHPLECELVESAFDFLDSIEDDQVY